MTSFTLNLISVKESFHDFFKKTFITPVNITSFTVVALSGKHSDKAVLMDLNIIIQQLQECDTFNWQSKLNLHLL